MSETVLNANPGRATGSSTSRRLRREGRIPAVVYGHGMDPLAVDIDRRELRAALSGAAGLNTILDLTVDGAVYPSLIKDIQRHPVRRTVLHVDFIQVDLNAEITVTVPVRLEGEAKEVASGNGLVDLAMTEIEVGGRAIHEMGTARMGDDPSRTTRGTPWSWSQATIPRMFASYSSDVRGPPTTRKPTAMPRAPRAT